MLTAPVKLTESLSYCARRAGIWPARAEEVAGFHAKYPLTSRDRTPILRQVVVKTITRGRAPATKPWQHSELPAF